MFESEKITCVCSLTGHVTNLWAWQHVLRRTKEVSGTISFSTVGNTEQLWSDQVKSNLQKKLEWEDNTSSGWQEVHGLSHKQFTRTCFPFHLRLSVTHHLPKLDLENYHC